MFTLGELASSQAATRVNLEQASKMKLWTPTRLRFGEGQRVSGKKPTETPDIVHRGSWERHVNTALTATWETLQRAAMQPQRWLKGPMAMQGVGEAHSAGEAG
jgi:hypothetical protein